MKDKRYAIVRVDDDYKHICPSAFEKVDDSSFCKLAIRKGGSCNVCPYGDTKEQLIRKVAQVIFRRKLKLYRKIWGGNMGSFFEMKDVYV